ncbi:DEAD-domain-containing protein [Fistulina hepatica ATCC 64428]|uniref:ATP-dependent RNA helicase DRS1 n=1 Tax=Fistulina hepatica ATCC 64428 TaxID=1128425 RepID=A0A0D7ALY8_9AGAR|nr:DEAD-domain-containing protein [Fistulina hepatica ATCC 64428]
MADYVMTIDSDTEDVLPEKHLADSSRVQNDMNPDFTFTFTDDPLFIFQDNTTDTVKEGSKPAPISVDDIIERRRLKRKRDLQDDGDDDSEDDDAVDEGEDISEDDDDDDGSEDPLGIIDEDEDEGIVDVEDVSDEEEEEEEGKASSDDDDSDEETQTEKDKKAAFFDSDVGPAETHTSFLTMNLSRPILKALTTMCFSKPTPIQAATIPFALLGKDIVGGAVTGSGKTAAFMIPMLERLLYRERGKKAAATRCLVLVPTRELAVQCFEVSKNLAAHTDIQFALIVGGLSVKAQEATLRSRPDVVIATPGRLIDHIRNSPSFTLDALDILVLDEADRMLEDGFADELTEIVKSCPVSRQTMLFSATMTDTVDDLVRMSLSKPVRLFVDPKKSTAKSLVQEFVRVRAGKEKERSALLVALCMRSFKTKVIVFLRSKKLAHQLRIVFGLLGLSCGELHGDLSQEQRLKALQQFRDGTVNYLMATDLASRGLDIKGVETVINYDMPGQLAQYLHRVGRTARAGKKGRSVTLVGEADRKILKAAIKHGSAEDQIKHRIIPPESIEKWSQKLAELQDDIVVIMKEEKEEKQLQQAEMELRKGENIIEHSEEIFSRPARTWFQTTKEKKHAEGVCMLLAFEGKTADGSKRAGSDKPKRDKYSGLSRKAKRRKMAAEEDEKAGENARATSAAIRAAKKAGRPTKLGVPEARAAHVKSKKKSNKSSATAAAAAGRVRASAGRSGVSVFGMDMGTKKHGHAHEGMRAKKGDTLGRLGKKPGKGKKIAGGKRKGKS